MSDEVGVISAGDLIRSLRKTRKMRVEGMAKAAEMSLSYLSKLENGKTNLNKVGDVKIRGLARALHISPELLGKIFRNGFATAEDLALITKDLAPITVTHDLAPAPTPYLLGGSEVDRTCPVTVQLSPMVLELAIRYGVSDLTYLACLSCVGQYLGVIPSEASLEALLKDYLRVRQDDLAIPQESSQQPE